MSHLIVLAVPINWEQGHSVVRKWGRSLEKWL